MKRTVNITNCKSCGDWPKYILDEHGFHMFTCSCQYYDASESIEDLVKLWNVRPNIEMKSIEIEVKE